MSVFRNCPNLSRRAESCATGSTDPIALLCWLPPAAAAQKTANHPCVCVCLMFCCALRRIVHVGCCP